MATEYSRFYNNDKERAEYIERARQLGYELVADYKDLRMLLFRKSGEQTKTRYQLT